MACCGQKEECDVREMLLVFFIMRGAIIPNQSNFFALLHSQTIIQPTLEDSAKTRKGCTSTSIHYIEIMLEG